MKAFLESMLSDHTGGISTVRVLASGWILAVTLVWASVALWTRAIPDLPAGVLALTGTLVGGKVVQRFGEKLEDSTP